MRTFDISGTFSITPRPNPKDRIDVDPVALGRELAALTNRHDLTDDEYRAIGLDWRDSIFKSFSNLWSGT
jgi:hypothetical protein